MAEQIEICVLCGWDAKTRNLLDGRDGKAIDCDLCGKFEISSNALAGMKSSPSDIELLPYLRCHIRQVNERGELFNVASHTWRHFAMVHKNTPVSKKLLNLLELIARRATPGRSTEIIETDFPLVDARDTAEMEFLIQTQIELENIERLRGPKSASLKAGGWAQLQAATVNGIPGRCFVAMSFDPDLKKEIYDEAILPAVDEDCKMKAVRIDLEPHNDNIVDRIVAEIRTCQFMVADFTGQKAGVYFEAGFAKGLGREVIWTCKKEDFKNVHFDIAQFSHIIWNNSADLRSRLTYKIKATISGAV